MKFEVSTALSQAKSDLLTKTKPIHCHHYIKSFLVDFHVAYCGQIVYSAVQYLVVGLVCAQFYLEKLSDHIIGNGLN